MGVASDRGFHKVELAMISRMAKAEKTLPDDFWATAAMQELACFLVKVEPLLTDEQTAVIVGIGALLCRQSRKEISAEVHAYMALGRARASNRPTPAPKP